MSSDTRESFDLKSIINYARFGRVLKQNKIFFLVQIFIYLVMSLYFIMHLELLSYYISYFSLSFLKDAGISKREILNKLSLYFLSFSGRLPTFEESFGVFLFSIIVISLTYRLNFLSEPFKIWVNFLFIILMTSALYFLFFSYAFPYSLNDFSLLYVIVQVGIISFIPLIMGFSLGLFSFSWWIILTNFLVTVFTLIYSFFFGVLRYSIFLYILKNFSFLWMANLFFNFGPLLDMIYITGIYGFYISILSKFTRKNIKVWRWVY